MFSTPTERTGHPSSKPDRTSSLSHICPERGDLIQAHELPSVPNSTCTTTQKSLCTITQLFPKVLSHQLTYLDDVHFLSGMRDSHRALPSRHAWLLAVRSHTHPGVSMGCRWGSFGRESGFHCIYVGSSLENTGILGAIRKNLW